MTATIQLNARLDRELKESGDAALSTIGLSPTQAVRALWEKAALRGKDLEEVAELLCPRGERANEGDDPLIRGRLFMEEAYKSLGIIAKTKRDAPSDKELLEEALYERELEKGLA